MLTVSRPIPITLVATALTRLQASMFRLVRQQPLGQHRRIAVCICLISVKVVLFLALALIASITWAQLLEISSFSALLGMNLGGTDVFVPLIQERTLAILGTVRNVLESPRRAVALFLGISIMQALSWLKALLTVVALVFRWAPLLNTRVVLQQHRPEPEVRQSGITRTISISVTGSTTWVIKWLNPLKSGSSGSRQAPLTYRHVVSASVGTKANMAIRSSIMFPVSVRFRLGLTRNRTSISVRKLTMAARLSDRTELADSYRVLITYLLGSVLGPLVWYLVKWRTRNIEQLSDIVSRRTSFVVPAIKETALKTRPALPPSRTVVLRFASISSGLV